MNGDGKEWIYRRRGLRQIMQKCTRCIWHDQGNSVEKSQVFRFFNCLETLSSLDKCAFESPPSVLHHCWLGNSKDVLQVKSPALKIPEVSLVTAKIGVRPVKQKPKISQSVLQGTGIRGLIRGMATLPRDNQELLVVTGQRQSWKTSRWAWGK